MPDLLLKARLGLVRRNLKEVHTVLDSIEKRREDLRRVLDLPREARIRSALRRIIALVNEIQAVVEQGETVAIGPKLDEVEQRTKSIIALLEEVATSVDSIRLRRLPLKETTIGETLQLYLVDNARKQLEKLDGIELNFDNQSLQARQVQDNDAALKYARDAWTGLYGPDLRDSGQLFREYVDLLGGLALRDGGFDLGICQIADELVRRCGRVEGVQWSLTIPVREEALDMTIARIIRLGFPEWTLWALPLAAHELGHVVASKSEDFQGVVEDQAGHLGKGWSREHLRTLLADAFAAYVMGPAYACSALLLRLEPQAAFASQDDRLTTKRAAIILLMLKRVNTNALEGLWTEIIRLLQAEWEEAVRQSGAAESPAAGEVKELLDREEEQLKWLAQNVQLSLGPTRRLSSKDWNRIDELAGQFGEAGAQSAAVQPGFEDELHHILNAAWLARLQLGESGNVDSIARTATELWRRIALAEGRHRSQSPLSPSTPPSLRPVDAGRWPDSGTKD